MRPLPLLATTASLLVLSPALASTWAQLSLVWWRKRDYARAWACAQRCGELGYQLDPAYISELKRLVETTE